MIEIEDEGECIPPALRAKLFTRFSRLSRLNRENQDPHIKSSGIGLYLSKLIVERMHGTIGYREAEKGHGSVFWFTLPREIDAEQAAPAVTTAGAPVTTPLAEV